MEINYINGFNLDESKFLIDTTINLYYFYKKFDLIDINNFNSAILYNSNEFKTLKEGYLNASYDLLQHNIIISEYIDIDFNKIIFLYKLIFLFFNKKKRIRENQNLNIDNSLYIFNESFEDNFKNKMFLRPGIVELQIVYSFLYGDKKTIQKAIDNIITNYENNKFYYNDTKSCWITNYNTVNDYSVYIKKMMTNAGFYCDKDKGNFFRNLEFFCENYKNALYNSDYILNWSFLNMYALNIINEKRRDNKKIILFNYNEKFILNLINNKKVLFITPFKEKVDRIYKSGNLYKINKNYENINLVTIESFLTTYPNKKHNCFIETVNYYYEKIDEEFKNTNFDTFTCSAGCYGLILCNYVYTKYKITTLYIGHDINTWFGIISNRNFNMMNEYCEFSDLNQRYLNIDKIEDNCYGK
jgi:hypothetical protein